MALSFRRPKSCASLSRVPCKAKRVLLVETFLLAVKRSGFQSSFRGISGEHLLARRLVKREKINKDHSGGAFGCRLDHLWEMRSRLWNFHWLLAVWALSNCNWVVNRASLGCQAVVIKIEWKATFLSILKLFYSALDYKWLWFLSTARLESWTHNRLRPSTRSLTSFQN